MLIPLMTVAVLSAPLAQQTDTVVPVNPEARLEISAMGGEVIVRTWDRSEMRVVADHSSSERIEISTGSSFVKIRSRRERGASHAIDYEITIPVTMDVEIGGTFLDIDIEGVSGEVTAHTVQGDLRLVGGSRFVSLHSTQGDVECEGVRGRLDIGSVNGSLYIRDMEGEIVGETVNGSLIMRGVRSGAVEVGTMNGEIVYEGTIENDGRYAFANHNGDMTITIPAGANANVSVSTFSGGFESDFPVTLTETRSGGKRFSFTLGSGGARLELESFGGTIQLRRP